MKKTIRTTPSRLTRMNLTIFTPICGPLIAAKAELKIAKHALTRQVDRADPVMAGQDMDQALAMARAGQVILVAPVTHIRVADGDQVMAAADIFEAFSAELSTVAESRSMVRVETCLKHATKP
jgi:hypothetical protein